jgi:N-acetyltransferase 10
MLIRRIAFVHRRRVFAAADEKGGFRDADLFPRGGRSVTTKGARRRPNRSRHARGLVSGRPRAASRRAAMRKKVDSRIRTLVENGVKLNERTLFVVVGDRAREQVVNLHYMLSKAVVKSRPNVLWCYKKELYLSSHKKKRVKQIKKMVSRGLMDPENEDPFSLFVASTDIKYTYYADTQKILGNTYGMAVLQDFEALTPNLLARTVETVEGGGIIVLLLSNLESLSQLYTLTMDVHARFRTESHQHVTARFNERFILSLGHCPTCIMMDDELNILPISSHVRDIQPVGGEIAGAADPEDLADLKRSLQETEPAGPLVSCCKTLDQAKAVVTFLDAASEKTLRSTVALTAARGRGKSAAMGIAVAGAIGMGYANVFVTSPSPENLNTFFRFVLKGFDALGYKEHLDYDLVESSNPAFGKAIVRVNVTRAHRQTIQYILPQHAERATQAELLVIDEAAAIPLPTVQKLLGPYLVFLCSTVNGYEGTGRALSLKLISNLRKEAAGAAADGGVASSQRV